MSHPGFFDCFLYNADALLSKTGWMTVRPVAFILTSARARANIVHGFRLDDVAVDMIENHLLLVVPNGDIRELSCLISMNCIFASS